MGIYSTLGRHSPMERDQRFKKIGEEERIMIERPRLICGGKERVNCATESDKTLGIIPL